MLPYRERLWAAPWLYVATALVIPASLIVFAPINPTAGVVVAILLYAGCVGGLIAAGPLIEVSEGTLSAGRAHIEVEFLGEATAFEGEEAVLERGRRLDARAWLLIRGWVGPVVKVQVLDAADPAPYWLLSTRSPDRLVRALDEARRTAPGRAD